MTKTTKFMKQSGSQGDSEHRHDGRGRVGGLRRAGELGWARERKREREREGEKGERG